VSTFTSRGCSKKRVYATKEDARRRWPKKRAYRCPLCDQYHVASKRSARQSR
jgi:hypothetical protein